MICHAEQIPVDTARLCAHDYGILRLMLGSRTSEVSYGALIDIGSGSVGVGIVMSDHSKTLPEIVWSDRVEMHFSGRKDETEKLRAIREALFSAVLNLSNTGLTELRGKNPKVMLSRILVTCSAPWSKTVTRSITYKQEEEFKVTETLVKELREGAEAKIQSDIVERDAVEASGLRIVERATVNIKVNGYNVHNPLGLKTKAVELAHISGLVPGDIIDAIDEVHDKVLEDSVVSIHTYLLVFYCVLRDLYPDTHAFCIVDISGEATEFGIVEDDVLTYSSFAPIGSNRLLRMMTEGQGVPHEHALSQLRGYQEKTLSEDESRVVEGYLVQYRQITAQTLQKIYDDYHVPQTIVVTSSPEIRGILSEQIMLILNEVTKNTHNVLELDDHLVRDIATESADVFLAISGRFFHKLHGCGEIE